MGGSSTTTVQQAPPSQEEKDYINAQMKLSERQLEVLNKSDAFNTDYMAQVKPLLEEQIALTRQQIAQVNDPANKAIAEKTQAAQLRELDLAERLAPLQEEVTRAQLDQIKRGNAATPEQAALIDQTTAAALESGKSDINTFTSESVDRLRNELAPALGLRPTDTPIIDRGQIIAREGVRQFGKLTSDLTAAGANAKLNYPLNAAAVTNAAAQFQQNISAARDQFSQNLADAASLNRLRLIGSAGDTVGGATSTGVNIANAARMNPLSFGRDSTQTTTKSMGLGDIMSGLGGVGGLLSGIAAVSDERMKENIKTHHRDNKGRRWVSYNYKGDHPSNRVIGVIAQEVEKTDPDAVLTNGRGLKFVDYSKLKKAS